MQIIDLLNSTVEIQFVKHREDLYIEAKQNVHKIKQENRKQYNLRHKKSRNYNFGDLVFIKRTQQGPGLKFTFY